jgi:hypothetical protein
MRCITLANFPDFKNASLRILRLPCSCIPSRFDNCLDSADKNNRRIDFQQHSSSMRLRPITTDLQKWCCLLLERLFLEILLVLL